ncbi:MAG: hypothetical protein WAV46_04205 [Candidatus Moraniibacteriota bacterium]
MKDSKDHLDIDLGFLDKKDSLIVTPKPDFNTGQTSSAPTSILASHKYNWKNILIIGGVILFFGWALFSDDSSSSNTTNNTSPSTVSTTSTTGNDVIVGQYSCSRDHSNQADILNPDENESQIALAQNTLENQTNELERLKREIDGSNVNEYSSQYQINQYNAAVDAYNSKLPAYKRAVADTNTRIDRYNAQVQKRNNYLAANCTKRY